MGRLLRNHQPDRTGNQLLFSLSLLAISLFTHVSTTFGQCPTIKKDDYAIELNLNAQSNQIRVLLHNANIRVSDYNVMLYNFDTAEFYYDESGKKETAFVPGLNQVISSGLIQFNNLPEGDFGIVLSKEGCDAQVVGYGYTGFPDSAIRIP